MIKRILALSVLIAGLAFSQANVPPTRTPKIDVDTLRVTNIQGKIGTLNLESATPNVSGAEYWQIDYDTSTTITNLLGQTSSVKSRIIYLEIKTEAITFADSLCDAGIGLTFIAGDVAEAQWKGNGWRIKAHRLN
jgi:hypothetical protein